MRFSSQHYAQTGIVHKSRCWLPLEVQTGKETENADYRENYTITKLPLEMEIGKENCRWKWKPAKKLPLGMETGKGAAYTKCTTG